MYIMGCVLELYVLSRTDRGERLMADDADGHRDTADGLGSIGAGQAGPDSWVCVQRALLQHKQQL